MKRHDGKNVLVTGGASGIGFATASRFAAEGAHVLIMDIDETAIKQALVDNNQLSGALVADVGDPQSVNQAFNELDQQMGDIDVLIANAGISARSAFLDIEWNQWRKVISTNLDGVFLTSQHAARRMMKKGNGVILMTASTNGVTAHPYYADYNATKAGVLSLARTMAIELAPTIRVSAICPGYVLTPMQQAEYTPEMLLMVNDKLPMKRHASPEEIAGLFSFLASSDAEYMTGHAVFIDGGEIV